MHGDAKKLYCQTFTDLRREIGAKVTFEEIDEARKSLGMTILELSNRAKIAPSTYWFIREGKTKPRAATLRCYAEALKGSSAPISRFDAVRAAYRAHLAYAARELGFDPVQVSNSPQSREFWKARAIAMACVAADLDVSHSDLGRALGLSKQVVNWNIKQTADLQHEAGLAWFVEAAGRLHETAGA